MKTAGKMLVIQWKLREAEQRCNYLLIKIIWSLRTQKCKHWIEMCCYSLNGYIPQNSYVRTKDPIWEQYIGVRPSGSD
jgi:hypothetical protein